MSVHFDAGLYSRFPKTVQDFQMTLIRSLIFEFPLIRIEGTHFVDANV